MVRALVGLLALVSTLPAVAAPAYRVEPASVALGEPLSLSITARAELLENLDLAPLEKHFELRDHNQGRDGREASLSLTLYPLHTGRIALPSLGLPMRAPTVTVAEQSESVPRVRFMVETDPAQYHVREPLRLTLEACDDGSLMWQRPQLASREGLLVRPLGQEQIEVEREGERCTARRWHWAVQPTASGASMLALPMMEASKFGNRLRFPPPPLTLNALPLPNWLPAEVAIGRPQISAATIPRQWPIGRPLDWRVEVSGAYSIEALKTLLRLQLGNLPPFSVYPPTIEELPADSGVPRHVISVYVLYREHGHAQLPDLLLPWYDPASGRLQQLQVKGASLEIVDPARLRLLAWGLGLAGLLIALLAGYLLWRFLAWRVHRQRALAELKCATELSDLVRSLCAFSLRAKTRPAATLGEWQQRMRLEANAPGLDELVAAVQAAHYSKARAEFSGLRKAALACLAAARPKSPSFKA